MFPFNVGKPASVKAWSRAGAAGGELVMIHPVPDETPDVAASFQIIQSMEVPGKGYMGQLQGLGRIRIHELRAEADGSFTVVGETIDTPEEPGPECAAVLSAVVRSILANPTMPNEAAAMFADGAMPVSVALEFACFNHPDPATKRAILSASTLEERAALARPHYEAEAARQEARDVAPRPPPPAPEDDFGEYPDDALEGMRYVARSLAAAGNHRERDFPRVLESEFDEAMEADPVLRNKMLEIIGDAVRTQRRSEASFPDPTPAERLHALLDRLPDQGILVDPGGEFTQQDAIGALEQMGADVPSARGYVLYTERDLQTALRGHGLNMGFGGLRDTCSEVIAQALCAALTKAGLPWWWPDDPAVKVFVPIRWQRRLPR